MTDNWTKREIGNFGHLYGHNPRPDYGTWRHRLRLQMRDRTVEASTGSFGPENRPSQGAPSRPKRRKRENAGVRPRMILGSTRHV